MYPHQNLAPNQPGFMGSPNSQQAWAGYQTQTTQPGFNLPNMQTYYDPSTGSYPAWFAQVTGYDIANVEYYLKQSINNAILELATRLPQPFPLVDLLVQNPDILPEYQRILGVARKVAILLMLVKPYGLVEDARIAAETAVRGTLVDRMGGPGAPIIKTLDQVLGANLQQVHANYVQVDKQVADAVMNVQNSISQRPAIGAVAGYNPAYPNAGHVNNGYATARIASSAMVNTVPFNGFVNQPLVKPPTPFDGIGDVNNGLDDIYKIALQGQHNSLVAPQTNQPQYPPLQTQPQVSQSNISQTGMLDAFSLMGKFSIETTDSVTEPTVSAVTQTESNITSTRSVLPRAGTHGGPTPPAEGLPSVGHYNFGKGPFDSEEYKQQPTAEQHLQHAPEPARTFDSELQSDDFFAHLQYEVDALEQSVMERKQDVNEFDSLDSALHAAKEQGFEVREPRLEIPYSELNAPERQKLCRQFRIRIVPAYLRTKSGLITVAEGTRREIIINRYEEVKYSDHETEIQQSKAFASWDKQVYDVAAATSIMADAASQDIWSEKFFTDKLHEIIEDNPQTNQDILLGDLIADRQIIDIDDVVVPRCATKDYQMAVITELQERGVDQAGILLENSVVRYRSFETAHIVVNSENRQLIAKIIDAQSSTDVVTALNEFKGQSTLPIREVARLLDRVTQQVNRYLATEFSNGWTITSAIGDYPELIEALIDHYDTVYEEETIRSFVSNIYSNAVHYAFYSMDLGNDPEIPEINIGTLSRVVLVPFYYTQYPIDFLDTAGAIVKENHPELYDFLNAVDVDGKLYEIKLVTLDNVVLTFCRSLGEDGLFFMVEKN